MTDQAVDYKQIADRVRRTKLPDGTIGHYQRHRDDCFPAAAAATCLNVPYDDVPAAGDHNTGLALPTLDELVELWTPWLDQHGLRFQSWEDQTPTHLPRWVGLARDADEPWHCLVIAHDSLLFDPMAVMSILSPWTPADIQHGTSFEPNQERQGVNTWVTAEHTGTPPSCVPSTATSSMPHRNSLA